MSPVELTVGKGKEAENEEEKEEKEEENNNQRTRKGGKKGRRREGERRGGGGNSGKGNQWSKDNIWSAVTPPCSFFLLR